MKTSEGWKPKVGDRVFRPLRPVLQSLQMEWERAKGFGTVVRVLDSGGTLAVRYDNSIKPGTTYISSHRMELVQEEKVWITEMEEEG